MTARKVPISYGLPMYDPAWEVQDELFPNAVGRVLGGCLIDEDNETDTICYICDECLRAEAKWRTDNDAHLNDSPIEPTIAFF